MQLVPLKRDLFHTKNYIFSKSDNYFSVIKNEIKAKKLLL